MKTNTRFMRLACAAFSLGLIANSASAQTFTLPPSNQAILGSTSYVATSSDMSVPLLARDYNVGQNAVVAANPGVEENGQLPNTPSLTVPTKFMLPPLPRQGIIVNLPEMRMYYYPAGTGTVMTFPIGIGKLGKTIPIMNTAVSRKVVNPTWTPPADIRAFDREQGIELPRAMGPGPDNPLGPYAIYLRLPTYLIHSTIFPESIGRRASFGCIRMNEDDIKQFFPIVTAGTQVLIIDMPIKIAWQDSELYMESHPGLEERPTGGIATAVKSIEQSLPQNHLVIVDWQLVAYLAQQPDGLPHQIGVQVN